MKLSYVLRHISRALKYLYFRLAYRNNKIKDVLEIKNILVISLDQIGDAILTSPLFSALKETFPGADITVVCGPQTQDIYNCIPQVRECMVFRANRFSSKNNGWGLSKRLGALRGVWRAKKWDLAFNVRGSWEMSLLFYLKAFRHYADTEVTQGKELWDKYKTKISRAPAGGAQMPVEKYRSLIILRSFQLLGIPYSGPVKINFELPQAVKQQAADLLGSNQVDLEKPLISVHPCAVEKAKLWTEDRWAGVCDFLVGAIDCKILLCGAPGDFQYLESIRSQMSRHAYNLAGKTSLMMLCGIISLSRFCLGIDSGPMHLSAALNIPGLVLYGLDDPKSCAPISGQIDYIFPAKGDPETRMMEITMEEVNAKLGEMLSLGH
ncbi:MAG: glycosyltransferase family 9 protein [Desulfarculaceae bacterium]|nr:glycosyltransferase family 9 protein [Desulfarculaceae bacterium]MCF8074003.1 glycosyltransferase family 9 protein [Desulfarculaceae bacterium]MCF8102689.1 glycosyltransferase family 9 protein [Desulfarculaceae bacterium]MCF8116070.1 glycosyltransferase family 9 protein [Desulfarculaceae bacterium]